MDLDAHEFQALLRHHCSSIVAAIDDGGIKPSKWRDLEQTGQRIRQLIGELKPSEKNMLPNIGYMTPEEIKNSKSVIRG